MFIFRFKSHKQKFTIDQMIAALQRQTQAVVEAYTDHTALSIRCNNTNVIGELGVLRRFLSEHGSTKEAAGVQSAILLIKQNFPYNHPLDRCKN
jgi:hypothetical protein